MLGALLHCMFGLVWFVLLMIIQFIVLNLQCQSLHLDESGGHGRAVDVDVDVDAGNPS